MAGITVCVAQVIWKCVGMDFRRLGITCQQSSRGMTGGDFMMNVADDVEQRSVLSADIPDCEFVQVGA